MFLPALSAASRTLLAGLIALVVGSPAAAEVLCAKPNGLVAVRIGCKRHEIRLDPVALGLQGPTGQQGPPGQRGERGMCFCPPPTTTTSSSSSSTSTSSTSSSTGTTLACDCCKEGAQLSFTTSMPEIGSGGCATSDGTITGMLLDETGANLCNLKAGGLYFGGAAVGVPQPSKVPDMGISIVKIVGCNGTTGDMTLAGTTDTDTGSNRNCTAEGINNPEYPGKPGCLFGPPLPIPNANSAATSTCLINRVATTVSGAANCKDGSTTLLNLSLLADIYLTGPTDGLIPCPLCSGPPGSETCQGGPNADQPCAPGTGTLGASYPTSHDCPPATSAFIGSLPLPFSLTTGTETMDATDFSSQNFVFCGFCGQQFSPSFQNPPHHCTADSQCVTSPFTRCRQRTSGAFGQGPAQTITETGSAPGVCIARGAPHDSTLVSVFCIPPSFNSTVDASADLPAPGAVALPGSIQFLPF